MRLKSFFILFCVLGLSACSEARYAAHVVKQIPFPGDSPKSQGTFKVGKPYKIKGRWYHPRETYSYTETGIASWYGPKFHGKQTANGEIFDKNELTAAHKTLQLPSLIRVTNLENGRSLVLRVNDRGPYSRGRILDVSERAASLLGFKGKGTAKVRIQLLGPESRQIAQVAKSGRDTRGYEIAMNNSRSSASKTKAPSPAQIKTAAGQRTPPPPSQFKSEFKGVKTASLQPVQRESLPPIQGHQSPDGRFLPDPVVKNLPVQPSKIYVQAGSFSVEQNALRLSESLKTVGPSKVYFARVDGRPFFRVRLGPYQNVAHADTALSQLVSTGNNEAVIIVD